VRFPTIMISDDAFKAKYSRKGFDEFFTKMQADRNKYRRIFLAFEKINIKELMSDERRMPVDVDRVVNDIVHEYNDMLKTPTDDVLAQMVATVDSLCEGIPYVLINEIQEKRKMKIPEHIRQASWLLTVLIRSYLHPNALADMKMTPEVLKIITNKIRLRYSQALIEPGTAVGIIAAQSFSEPLTQYMLDAHHRSASGGTSKSGMTKAKEVLGARDTDKLENPSMLIPVLPEIAENKGRVQEIANNIEVMKFRRFVVSWQVFFEKFGEPVYSKYTHEKMMIREFLKLNPLLTPPGDLTKWCIRFHLDKTSLILKNMPLELIISRIRETFPDMFIVYTPENANQIVVRMYMRASMFKSIISTNGVIEWKDSVLDTIIRGVEGISNARVEPMIRNKVNPDGSISRATNTWGIVTTGTNLYGILEQKYVDKLNVQTDAIQETYQMFGIEAARQKIISELRNIIPDINHRHYLVYADEMTRTGKVTRIDSSGMKVRKDNPLLRIGFSAPLGTMEEAAINNLDDNISGITAPLLIGSIPRHGTLYNSFYVDEEFVRKNVKRPDDIIETLFE
jgi:DNA-directed RNA polymerase beta' subunit